MKTIFKNKNNRQKAVETKDQPEINTREYEIRFIRPANMKAKTGKTIYLRPEYHRRVARILQLLEDSSISLTDYVDNVFSHHFQLFEQEIRDFCTKNNDPII